VKIAFHLATPPAPRPELDAAGQEIDSLRRSFGGPLKHLYPGARYRPWIRRRHLRRQQIDEWLALDRAVDLHHVVSDRALDYPVLAKLRCPVVFRLLTPVQDLATLARLARYGSIVVSAAAEAERLRRLTGVPAVAIPPGIELERFADVAPPPTGPFTVLFGSAPWTRRQFVTKGLDPLLQALGERPEMRLIILWRGVLRSTLEARLRAAGLAARTEVLAERVKPEEVLARAHAAVLVPSSPRVVKAFPHSLLEALAAGRPVLTSDQLALADWTEERGCGLVVPPTADGIGRGLDRLAADYGAFRRATTALDMSAFSVSRCVATYRDLYQRILGAPLEGGPFGAQA
jgi:glycosyltransferase involved in cell wall biosynthesis